MSRIYTVLFLLVLVGAPCSAAYWGVDANFADQPRLQSEYEAPLLAQRGVNCVFLNPRGTKYNWPSWAGVERAFDASGISCLWDLPSAIGDCERIFGFEPGTLEMDDRATNEDGSRAYFGSEVALGNFFDPRFPLQLQRASAALAARVRTLAGCRVTIGANLRDGSHDESALASWRTFLAEFFGDESPARDTSGDSATFNSAFSMSYSAWRDVPQFTAKDLKDSGKQRLVDMWLSESYADYIDGVCGAVLGGPNRRALAGAGVEAIYTGAGDAALLASKSSVNTIFTGSADAVPALECIAATFGKNVFASGVKLAPGNLAASRQRALRLLPFVGGATFDYSGLVRGREGANPSKLSGFDSAFQVIPELAPFAGRFRVNRLKVLWILSSDRKFKDVDYITEAHCVSEAVLALNPKCVDLSRYKAIIYRGSSPSLTPGIARALYEYALRGGSVFIEGHLIGSGSTINGKDNARAWMEGITLKGGFMVGESDKLRQVRSRQASCPPSLVRRIGDSGRWVYVNVYGTPLSSSPLDDIVRQMSGITLPSPLRVRVYQGESCALAFGGASAESATINCPYPEAAIFNPLTGFARVGRAKGGTLQLSEKVEAWEAKLWVVKPYGKPVVLYADGTLDHAASLADGEYSGNALKFRFAERAYISSPSKPKSLIVDGCVVPFNYDDGRHLVKIERTGEPVEARLEYAQ